MAQARSAAGLIAARAASAGAAAAEIAAPVEVERPGTGEDARTDRPWIVIVWNDPVNLMSYVVYVFQKLFGFAREKATHLMLQVHYEGKAIVAHGSRERCEADVCRLHAYGLWATLRKDS